MKFVGKWMTLEEIIKYLYPKRQIQHVLLHKWMLTLNLWICVCLNRCTHRSQETSKRPWVMGQRNGKSNEDGMRRERKYWNSKG